MGHAVLQPEPEAGLLPMNINMLVNAKGKVCMTHDDILPAIPLWVKYRQLAKEIDILFDNGTTETVLSAIPEQLDSYLVNTNRVTIIRVENREPVEGWETILLNESI
jgi:hypothetical protein